MTTMISEVYDALRSVDVPEDKARAAAEAMAAHHPVLNQIRSDLRVLKWQVGMLAAAVALFGPPSVWLLVRVAAKVGALPV